MRPGELRAVGLKHALLSAGDRRFQQPERGKGSLFGFSCLQWGSLVPREAVSLKAGFQGISERRVF